MASFLMRSAKGLGRLAGGDGPWIADEGEDSRPRRDGRSRRSAAGPLPTTLEIEDRDDGLHWSLTLPESRGDIREAIERQDLKSTSWQMRVSRDRWEGLVRHVEEVAELLDVAIVTRPAYADARAEYRNAPEDNPPAEATTLPEREENTIDHENENNPGGGSLRVESRTAGRQATPESRIIEAIGSVQKGESRDLTRVEAAPVEPDDLRTQLLVYFRERSVVAETGVPIIVTDRKAIKFPVLLDDVDSAFYNELEQIAESDPELDEYEVAHKAIKTLTRMSSEAVEDSDPDLLRTVQDSINVSLALKGDRELLVGNDVKGFKGITQISGTQSLAVGGALDYDHLIKAAGLLAESKIPGRTSRSCRAGADRHAMLKDGDGNYLAPPAGLRRSTRAGGCRSPEVRPRRPPASCTPRWCSRS